MVLTRLRPLISSLQDLDQAIYQAPILHTPATHRTWWSNGRMSLVRCAAIAYCCCRAELLLRALLRTRQQHPAVAPCCRVRHQHPSSKAHTTPTAERFSSALQWHPAAAPCSGAAPKPQSAALWQQHPAAALSGEKSWKIMYPCLSQVIPKSVGFNHHIPVETQGSIPVCFAAKGTSWASPWNDDSPSLRHKWEINGGRCAFS